jgi:hypothetical protein
MIRIKNESSVKKKLSGILGNFHASIFNRVCLYLAVSPKSEKVNVNPFKNELLKNNK